MPYVVEKLCWRRTRVACYSVKVIAGFVHNVLYRSCIAFKRMLETRIAKRVNVLFIMRSQNSETEKPIPCFGSVGHDSQYFTQIQVIGSGPIHVDDAISWHNLTQEGRVIFHLGNDNALKRLLFNQKTQLSFCGCFKGFQNSLLAKGESTAACRRCSAVGTNMMRTLAVGPDMTRHLTHGWTVIRAMTARTV